MPTTIDKVKDGLKQAGVGKMVLWSAGRDLFPLAQALGDGEEINAAVFGEIKERVVTRLRPQFGSEP